MASYPQINFRVTSETSEALNAAAEKAKRSRAQFARLLFQYALKKYQKGELPKDVLGSDSPVDVSLDATEARSAIPSANALVAKQTQIAKGVYDEAKGKGKSKRKRNLPATSG